MGRGQWSRWGRGHVRGLVARNRHRLSRLGVRRNTRGEPTTWSASINSTALGEFLEREIAMRRVEELVESNMLLVLHDWELYRAEKAKR
jgi:hypothetical protein